MCAKCCTCHCLPTICDDACCCERHEPCDQRHDLDVCGVGRGDRSLEDDERDADQQHAARVEPEPGPARARCVAGGMTADCFGRDHGGRSRQAERDHEHDC